MQTHRHAPLYSKPERRRVSERRGKKRCRLTDTNKWSCREEEVVVVQGQMKGRGEESLSAAL